MLENFKLAVASYFTGISVIAFIIFALLLSSKAFAFGDNSYSYQDMEKRQGSIRKYAHIAKPSATVIVDRYNEQSLRNDPSVLIALPKPLQNARKQALEARTATFNGITITSQLCDENGC